GFGMADGKQRFSTVAHDFPGPVKHAPAPIVDWFAAQEAVEEFVNYAGTENSAGASLNRLYRHASGSRSAAAIQVISSAGKKHVHHRLVLKTLDLIPQIGEGEKSTIHVFKFGRGFNGLCHGLRR